MVHKMWFSVVNTRIHVTKVNVGRSVGMHIKAEIWIDWNLLGMKLPLIIGVHESTNSRNERYLCKTS